MADVGGLAAPTQAQRAMGKQGTPVAAIRMIQADLELSLPDAKRLYEHVTIVAGECRQCRELLGATAMARCCVKCGALNLDP